MRQTLAIPIHVVVLLIIIVFNKKQFISVCNALFEWLRELFYMCMYKPFCQNHND